MYKTLDHNTIKFHNNNNDNSNKYEMAQTIYNTQSRLYRTVLVHRTKIIH